MTFLLPYRRTRRRLSARLEGLALRGELHDTDVSYSDTAGGDQPVFSVFRVKEATAEATVDHLIQTEHRGAWRFGRLVKSRTGPWDQDTSGTVQVELRGALDPDAVRLAREDIANREEKYRPADRTEVVILSRHLADAVVNTCMTTFTKRIRAAVAGAVEDSGDPWTPELTDAAVGVATAHITGRVRECLKLAIVAKFYGAIDLGETEINVSAAEQINGHVDEETGGSPE